MNVNIWIPLLLATLAGLSTLIGSFLGIVVHKPGPRFMAATLGFSAGVMVLVAFVELLGQGIQSIGFGPAQLAFFGGLLIMFLIDNSIPHDYLAEHNLTDGHHVNRNLARTGLFVALGIAIHNFPEGLAVFAGGVFNLKLGAAIAIAIALHNIPEGVAVSVPVYTATGSRRKAFLWSALSGLAEPLGAVAAALFLMPILNQAVLGYVLAAVAGIMVFISIDELVPTSRACGHEHLSIAGFIGGMMVMSFSLWLMML
ncbi:MAG: zinc transporter ZupT [Candidatus Margulisbacteria bacterium]|jgi:ZIP family zinc transporter|nr:zinc transporter ZupT [Candidatus Margulisiibacteriota bacterium]